MKKKCKKRLSILLTLAGPFIVLAFLTFDQFGFIDKWTSQDHIETAIKRLENTGGYPISWIYNDSIDKKHFNAIFKLIEKNSNRLNRTNYTAKTVRQIEKGEYPLLITIGGSPIEIKAITKTWSQDEKYIYTDNHPILFALKAKRHNNIETIGGKVCTLGDLKNWAKNRKSKLLYFIGGLGLAILTIAIILLQTRIEQNINKITAHNNGS